MHRQKECVRQFVGVSSIADPDKRGDGPPVIRLRGSLSPARKLPPQLTSLRPLLQFEAAQVGKPFGFAGAALGCRDELIQQLHRRRKLTLAHEEQRGVVERVGIGRLHGEGFLVARERFILPADLLLKNAEIEPRVREIRIARDRLPVGEFRFALASELVQDIAEVERE